MTARESSACVRPRAAARAAARRPQRVDAGEEALRAGRWSAPGARPAGTWPQPSSTICSALGQPLGDVAAEAARDQLVVRAPDEQRGRLELGQARVEAVAAERRVEVDRCGRAARKASRAPARAVDALELVDDDVGHARVDQVAVGEQRPELALDRPRPKRWGSRPSSGRSSAHERVRSRARTNATAGHSSAERRRRARARAGRPRSPRGRPSSCRPGARARSPSASITPSTVRAKQRRVVAAPRRACTRTAEAGQVERVDAVAAAQRGRGVEERRLGRAEAVEQQHVGALAHRQREIRRRPDVARRGCAASGGRPLGRRNRPSKPTARSRSPRA